MPYDQAEYMKGWRAKNKAHVENYQKRWRAQKVEHLKSYESARDKEAARKRGFDKYWRDPEYARREQYRRIYGMDDATYARFNAATTCDLCKKEVPPRVQRHKLHIDHDHRTGKIRGFLCNGCNTGLGKLGDDEAGLLRALEYIRANN